MNKVTKLVIFSFVSTIVNNILWLVLIYVTQNIVPYGMETYSNVLVTVFCISLHTYIYLIMYRKCYKGLLERWRYIAVCTLPYVVLLLLAIRWFMTFPLL